MKSPTRLAIEAAMHEGVAYSIDDVAALLQEHDTEVAKLTEELEAARAAAINFIAVIDAAGLYHLSCGVQLGATVWYVKASDSLDALRAALSTPTKEQSNG